ncbi:MAG: hypothetical protein ACAI38_01120 [Myxococcota bacterium]
MFASTATAIPLRDVRLIDPIIAQKLRVELGASAETVTADTAAKVLTTAERRTFDALVRNQSEDESRTRRVTVLAIGGLVLANAYLLMPGVLAALPPALSTALVLGGAFALGGVLRKALDRLSPRYELPLPESLEVTARCNRIDEAFEEVPRLRRGEFAWLEKQVDDGLAELAKLSSPETRVVIDLATTYYRERLEKERADLA